MKKSLVKVAVMVTLSATMAGTLSGCVGSSAVTGLLMKFNVKAVDNRYARGGLNMLLAPVYGLTIAADYLVFNSIEFWTGKNIISGSPHIFDTKTKTMLNINDDLDPSLHKAPIGPLTRAVPADKEIYSAQVSPVNDSTLDFNLVYANGETAVLRGEKNGDVVNFYMDGEFVTTTSLSELEMYVAN